MTRKAAPPEMGCSLLCVYTRFIISMVESMTLCCGRCCGIHGAGLPPLYILHQFAVVMVCCAGGELKGSEARAAQSLHGSVHTVDKVEVLEGCVNAFVGCASGVSLPTCDNM